MSGIAIVINVINHVQKGIMYTERKGKGGKGVKRSTRRR